MRLIALLWLTSICSAFSATYNFTIGPGDTISFTVSNCVPCTTNPPPPADTNCAGWNIVFDGDSHTESNGTPYPAGATNFGDVADLFLQRHPQAIVHNVAFGGQSVAMMNADAASQVDNLYMPSAPVNICFVCPGAADWLVQGGRDWAMWQEIARYMAQRRAAGWQVILASFPNATNVQQQQQANLWTNYSALIRANWPELVHGFVDLAMVFNNYNNSTYYQADHIHLNTLGTGIYSDMAEQKILSVGNAKIADQLPPLATDVSGLVLWWEASQQFYGNGAGVTNLADSSASKRQISQVAGLRCPTFTSSWTGGRAAISFDGINDLLARADGFPISNYTAMVVLATERTNAIEHILSSDYQGHWLYQSPYISPGAIHAENDDCFSTAKIATNTPTVLTVSASAAKTFRFFINGAFINQDQPATPFAQGPTVRLGDITYSAVWADGPQVPFKGKIGAVLVWNRTLSDAECMYVSTNHARIYGIAH